TAAARRADQALLPGAWLPRGRRATLRCSADPRGARPLPRDARRLRLAVGRRRARRLAPRLTDRAPRAGARRPPARRPGGLPGREEQPRRSGARPPAVRTAWAEARDDCRGGGDPRTPCTEPARFEWLGLVARPTASLMGLAARLRLATRDRARS